MIPVALLRANKTTIMVTMNYDFLYTDTTSQKRKARENTKQKVIIKEIFGDGFNIFLNQDFIQKVRNLI